MKKRDKRRDYETKSKYTKTECVLCSEDWRDIIITYVPQLNNIPIENNYAGISQGEIKKAYKQNKRRSTEEESEMIAYVKFILYLAPKFLL